jgi:SAM-dependent methyltransferase
MTTTKATPPRSGNLRKKQHLEYAEAGLDAQDGRTRFNAAYREDDRKFMRFLIPSGKRILELGCGTGELLAALQPARGVGVDFAPRTIAKARESHADLHFVLGDVEDPATLSSIEGRFDYIVIADTIGMFEDIDGTLQRVHHLCTPSTRIIISYYSHLWEPIIKLAELLGVKGEAADDQLHCQCGFSESDGSCGLRGDQP